MGWFTVARLLLSALLYVAEIIRDRQLLNAGEASHLAKDLALLQKRLAISQIVADEVGKMTDQELDDELRT